MVLSLVINTQTRDGGHTWEVYGSFQMVHKKPPALWVYLICIGAWPLCTCVSTWVKLGKVQPLWFHTRKWHLQKEKTGPKIIIDR